MAGNFDSLFASQPFGLGTPVAALMPPDPPEEARFIDILTRDYEIGDDREFKRMPITRQRVFLALLGMPLPRKIDSSALQRMREGIEARLQFLVDDGSIRIDNVAIENPRVGMLVPTVAYTDLSTQESDLLAF